MQALPVAIRVLACLMLLLVPGCTSLSETEDRPQPPSLAYPDLFERVALSQLFEPKDWADMEPTGPPSRIEAEYDRLAPLTDQALRTFVDTRFLPPGEAVPERPLPEGLRLDEHIDALWPVLIRGGEEAEGYGSLLPLPNPYIVPGGRFREAYYWDTYFSLLGTDDEFATIRRDVADNFAYAVARYGFVPNGNRSYYLSRSQPPFFYLIVGLLDEADPAAAWAEYLPALRAEHAFWTRSEASLAPGEARGRSVAMPDGSVLQRYWDGRTAPRDESYRYDVATAQRSARPDGEVYRDLRAAAESGWDFSSRWLGEAGGLASIRTTAIVPVDLNALLFGLENAIAAGCARAGDDPCAAGFARRAADRQRAIDAHLWNPEGYYDDYDLAAGDLRSRPSMAMLYPVFTGASRDLRARIVLDTFEDELLAPGGVLPTPVRSGEQWDAPNGWAPHQWIAVRSLIAMGKEDKAEEIARRWLGTVARAYCETGRLTEKYDVVSYREGGGGEYPNQDGFGWTNGVTIRLIEDFPGLSSYGWARPAAPGAEERCASL